MISLLLYVIVTPSAMFAGIWMTPNSMHCGNVQCKHCVGVKFSRPDMTRPSLQQLPAVAKYQIWFIVRVSAIECATLVEGAKVQWLYSLFVFYVVFRVLVAPRGGSLQHQVLPSYSIEQVWPESMVWKTSKDVAVWASPAILQPHHHSVASLISHFWKSALDQHDCRWW